jgi:hypothetical protein
LSGRHHLATRGIWDAIRASTGWIDLRLSDLGGTVLTLTPTKYRDFLVGSRNALQTANLELE